MTKMTFCSVVIIHVISTSGVRRTRHEKEPVDRTLVIQPPSKPISLGLWASQVGCKLPAYKCAASFFFFPFLQAWTSEGQQGRESVRETVQQGFSLAQTTNCGCGGARDESARTHEAPRKHLLCAGCAHQK